MAVFGLIASVCLVVPAHQFDAGGWKLDVQFLDVIGAPYLLAHGLGNRVADATAFEIVSAAVFAAEFREDPAKYWDFEELAKAPEYRANPFPDSEYPGLKAFMVKGKGPKNTAAEGRRSRTT